MWRMVLMGCVVLVAGVARPAPLAFDNFENHLGQWTGQGYGSAKGEIVADPLRAGNHVLSFTGTTFGGDIFSTPEITLMEGQAYSFSLEYLGRAVADSAPGNYGGFAGLSDVVLQNPYAMRNWPDPWYFGTEANYPGLRVHLIDDGRWHSYSFDFVWHKSATGARSDVVHLMLEDYYDPLNPDINNSVGDVFFDNVQLSIIPEPSWMAFIGLAAAGLIGRARRRGRPLS
jgi:hypothetical protein